MQQDLIITGFGAFPGVKHNPSALVAEAVARDQRWARLGLGVRAEVLLVGYERVAERLSALAKSPPRALLMFGVAAKRRRITPEAVAVNRITRALPDAVKSRPGRGIIAPGGPAFRRARADMPGLVHAARIADKRAKLSGYAGRYVCNFALWHGLAAMPRETRVVFIHIPMPRKPGTKDRRPDLAALIRAGKAIAMRMVKRF